MKPCPEQLSMFSVEASRDCASLSVLPGSEEARRMTATSGLKCCGLLKNSGPLGSLARMLLGSSAWSSPARLLEWRAEPLTASRTRTIMRRYCHDRKTCCSSHSSETLSVSDTKSRHLLFRLVPSEPPTGGTGSPLWPTVRARETGDYQYSRGDHGKPVATLSGAVKLWPTPAAQDGKNATLPPSQVGRDTLPGEVLRQMLPTPKAQNARGGGQRYGAGGPSLDVVAGGQLNPAWVEWLMGFPAGWTDIG